MLEKPIEEKIKKYLKKCGHLVYKIHGSPYQEAGIPDLVGILTSPDHQFGRFFGIEVKKPGEEPTELQYVQLDKIEAAGGLSFWVSSLEEVQVVIPPCG